MPARATFRARALPCRPDRPGAMETDSSRLDAGPHRSSRTDAHQRMPPLATCGSASSEGPPSCDAFRACFRDGLETTRHSSRLIPSVTAASNTRRAAVCITGQFRGLPVAVLNWQMSSLFRLLRAGGLVLDVFMVTSESKTFAAWWPFVQRQLRPVRVVVMDPRMTFNRTSSISEG